MHGERFVVVVCVVGVVEVDVVRCDHRVMGGVVCGRVCCMLCCCIDWIK